MSCGCSPLGPGGPTTFVETFNGRDGVVVSELGDYDSSLIGNDSGTVPGATVSEALDALAAAIVASTSKFNANWGVLGAPAVAAARFIPRTNGAVDGVFQRGEYPAPVTGTFTFTLTWRVGGTVLPTDTVALAVMRNGVATILTSSVAPVTGLVGQASASIAVVAGDGISVRLTQSGTEAQANWNFSANVRAT